MTSLVFPDVNVWVALASSFHFHHKQARQWYESLDRAELIFCRFTQLGLLRLLTTAAVMGSEVLTQRQAWHVYDTFVRDGGARLLYEPGTLEESFRMMSKSGSVSPKDWGDSYLAAFAVEMGAALVTFDKSLGIRTPGSIVL